ncbi:MAG: DUF2796 domain-containing protein [Sulfuricellaceae bacterium]
MNRLLYLTLLLTAHCLTPSPAMAEPGAHVHGIAKLQVAVDGDTLTLDFESPLDNLLGFEHMPHSEKQIAAVRAMAERLNKPGNLFLPTPAASCTVLSTKLESPVLAPAKKANGDGHADLDAEFIFKCAQPGELRGLEVRLFDAFPNLRRLDVQVAGARGQSAAKLTPTQRRISW